MEVDPDAYLYIKEKYGLLRIEMDSRKITNREYIALQNEAEEVSPIVCECCGRPGDTRDLPWILTLCDACFKGSEADRCKAEDETEKRWLQGENDSI